jgi:DNA (cytosine-5)-methyltransferase 1
MRELIVDSFAGGGGASTGIELALGRSPDVAINHDVEALALHRINHPETLHLPHNVWKVDPVAVTGGTPVGLLWASPDCKHFSKAKGGRPVKRSIRDLAWVVVRWARQVRPRVIILENVEEFRDWGPISEDGQPCKARRGETFKRWEGELKRLGYRVEHRELRACDYGAPTIRKRLFLIARRDGQPIVWPAPTHGRPEDPEVIAGAKLPWRTAASIIDWSLPCHSIFLSREEGRAVGVNRPLAEATMARIARGVKRYVLDAAKPFVVRTAHGETGPNSKRWGNGDHNLAEPLPTVTASNDFAAVTPFVTKFRANSVGSTLDEPLHTVTANGENRERPGGCAPLGLVAPVLTYAQQGGLNRSPEEPHSTICASAKDQNALIAGTLIQTGYGEREGQDPRALDPALPLGTVMAGGVKHAAVAAFLAQHNTGVVGHAMTEPVSTLTAGGHRGMPQQALVEAKLGGDVGRAADVRAFLTKYYGTGDGQELAEPMHTVVTKDRYGLVTVEIGGEPYVVADIGMRMLSPRELYRAQGFPDSYIIDRGLRVEPREGFGEDDGEADIIPITKTAQVRMCGNSVCPPLAQALVAANYQPRESASEAPRRKPAELPLFPMEAAE